MKKWTKDCSTIEEIYEVIVVEQLINNYILSESIYMYLNRRKLTTSLDVGQLKDTYRQSWGTSRLVANNAFIKTSHLVKECRKNQVRSEPTCKKQDVTPLIKYNVLLIYIVKNIECLRTLAHQQLYLPTIFGICNSKKLLIRS